MPSYGERLGGGAVCPLCRETASSEAEMRHRSRVDPLPSSEAEVRCVIEGPEGSPRARRKMSHPLEGRSATLERGGVCPAGPRGTLERGGDRSAGSRGMRMGRMLGFFESFTFFQIGRRPWAFVGPVALTYVFVFESGFSASIRVSLIVAPDSSPRGFGRVKGFGQRVFRRFLP